MLEGVARGEHEPSDALRVLGCHKLADGATRVVAHERHVRQVELVHQLGEQPRHRARAELCIRLHRPLVRTQRQFGDDAARVGRKLRHDHRPQHAACEQPVDEQDHRTLAARVLIADASG